MQKTWLLFHHIPNKWGLLQIQIWKMNSRKWDNIYSKGNKLDFLSYKKTDENSLACHSFVRLLNFFCLFSWIIEVERNQFSLAWSSVKFSIWAHYTAFYTIAMCALCSRFRSEKVTEKISVQNRFIRLSTRLQLILTYCTMSSAFFKSQVNHVEELCTQVHTCVNWGSWHNIRNSYHKIDYIDFRSTKLSRKRTFKKKFKDIRRIWVI